MISLKQTRGEDAPPHSFRMQQSTVICALPWPPSINRYYRHILINKGVRTLLSKEGRRYRETVIDVMAASEYLHPFTSEERLAVSIDAYPPDKRKRDLDNIQKPLLDALEHIGIYPDDGQIDFLVTKRHPPTKPGYVVVTVEAFTEDVIERLGA